jgi:hypothetical protein
MTFFLQSGQSGIEEPKLILSPVVCFKIEIAFGIVSRVIDGDARGCIVREREGNGRKYKDVCLCVT